MQTPVVNYAKSGGTHIAYQVYGQGQVNVVETPGSISHLDYYWQEPGMRGYLEELGSFARVAIFDKRGTGLSDRNVGVPTFEERMDDIRAVMDAAGFEDAVLIGISEGVPMSILFAASFPARARGLILYGGEARGQWAPDYPWASTKEQWEDSLHRMETAWGTPAQTERAVSSLAPSKSRNPDFIRWFEDMRRNGASPGAQIGLARSEMNMDVRSVLPTVHVPTLVIHQVGDRAAHIEEGRYVARNIPGARMVELKGEDHIFTVDRSLADRILREIREFVSGVGPAQSADRVLTTVLFTDIVDSTKRAAELGDSRWHALLERHNTIVTEEVRRHRGSIVKNTGDGFLATFDGPTRALRCGWAVTRSAGGLGVQVRAGVHTGECIVGPSDISGIAVHIASRIMDLAGPGEVMVSSTVRDLVYGSDIGFADRGDHTLKGIEEVRRIYSVQTLA